MLLIMVGNMASIFTQVYSAKVTSICSFFPHLLHTVPFTSLSLLWALVDIFMLLFNGSCHRPNVQWGFCLPSSRWKSSNQSHCNLKSKIKMSILLFGLPCCRLAVQGVDIHYAGVHIIPEDVLPCFDWEAASIIFQTHLIMTIYTIHVSIIYSWMFVADLLGSHYDLISCLCEQHFGGVWICPDKSYNSIVLPNIGHQVWAAILVWFVNTMDHSTRFTNTLWKILLIHWYSPIAVCFTSQQVLQ